MGKTLNIVCIGGGSGGTSTLLSGLKDIKNAHLTSITSMADDGGSSGRLRKGYSIMPPGNLVSCIASLVSDENSEIADLLMYRFPGNQTANKSLDGHKLGNLIMLAQMLKTNDIYKALDTLKKFCGVDADVLPATDERTHLSAITTDGRRIHSETTLDLALYAGPLGLKKIYITPKNPKVNPKVINNLLNADLIISGPGDLYTNQLPVLVIPQIKEAFLTSKAKKFFIANIANKPFETKNYSLNDFIVAIREHLGAFAFDTVIANNNFTNAIPKKYRYTYVKIDDELRKNKSFRLIEDDFVDKNFPIHHNPQKLLEIITKNL